MLYCAVLKRPLDVLLVVLTSPIWGVLAAGVAIVIWLRLGQPILYRQQRPGLGGRPFVLLKFRTMTDAHDERGQLRPDAQRLSGFGRWLRSTSLDELPSFLNVLRGDMSIVGPRPLLMAYLDRYTPEQARRHEVRPGITGWAQVHGRNALSWDEKFKLDVWYVDHVSPALDATIIAKTLLKVVEREGITAAGHSTAPEFTGPNPDEGRRED